MYRVVFLVLATLLVAWSPSCGGTTQPPAPVSPPKPVPAADAAPPAPTVVPVPIPPGDAYDDACANELRLGCPEGHTPNCAAVMRHADQGKITKVTVACITAAGTARAVRACGFIKCAGPP